MLVLIGLFHSRDTGDVYVPTLKVDVEFERIGNGGQDRCCNTGCLARVTPGKREKVAKVKKESQATEIYFNKDSSIIQQQGAADLHKFISSTVDNTEEITVVGYTDGCGTWSYNQKLSMRRAKKVKEKILSINPAASVVLRAAGEISHDHDPKSRKVHVTLTSNIKIYEPPPAIVADVYLIDSSGSISDTQFEMFRRAINYHRPSGSRIYIATTSCVAHKKSFSSISPIGGTEIWYAYWYILDKMKPGERLMIISDFESKYPLTGREQEIIEKKVRDKQVKVNIIYL